MGLGGIFLGSQAVGANCLRKASHLGGLPSFLRHFGAGKVGTILSGLMIIGVAVHQAEQRLLGRGGLSLPRCTYCTCVPFCIFWGRDTPCIIVEVGADKWGRGSSNLLGLGNLFICSVGQKTGGGDGVVAPC